MLWIIFVNLDKQVNCEGVFVAVYLAVRYCKIQLRNSPFATLLCFKGRYFYGKHCQYVC